jgi:hypothetical protein
MTTLHLAVALLARSATTNMQPARDNTIIGL